MTVRNYVGARYVPKFATPTEWQASTSYEAMTIVTYNNSSYTSKIPVPPTVGNPAENQKYWALTGNYNAQVEEYRQTVEEYRQTVEEYRQTVEERYREINETNTQAINTEAENRKKADNDLKAMITDGPDTIILFGDSWCDTRNYGTDVDKNPSATAIEPTFKAAFDCNVINYAYGGSGFETGHSFNQQLDEFIQAKIDPDKIRFVCLVGGVNNLSLTDSVILSQYTSWVNRLTPLLNKNTPIYYFFNYSCVKNDLLTRNKDLLAQAERFNKMAHATNRVIAHNLMGLVADFKPDRLHPTYDSYKTSALNMMNLIKGGDITEYPVYNQMLKPTEITETAYNTLRITMWLHNDVAHLITTAPADMCKDFNGTITIDNDEWYDMRICESLNNTRVAPNILYTDGKKLQNLVTKAGTPQSGYVTEHKYMTL